MSAVFFQRIDAIDRLARLENAVEALEERALSDVDCGVELSRKREARDELARELARELALLVSSADARAPRR